MEANDRDRGYDPRPDNSIDSTTETRLPLNPIPGNSGQSCETTPDDTLPTHLDGCACETHTGVCRACGYKVTVGPSGTEYGHKRPRNRQPDDERVPCPHRPTDRVDPKRNNAVNQRLATDGGVDVPDEPVVEDGEAHCPVEGCDWWVPEGMEYLYEEHRESHDAADSPDDTGGESA
jgi:hypothetical protein